MTATMAPLIETDARSRVTLPGNKKNRRYLVDEQVDGTLILRPAVVITEAQANYDANPERQARVAAAAASPTVRRSRRRPVAID
jgi:hypothetical protein